MSLRVDTAELIPGALVIGNTGLGVLGSAIPDSGQHGASILYNDKDTGDNAKEVRARLGTPTLPAGASLFVWENGALEITGAADGTYVIPYTLIVDGVEIGASSATVTVGTPTVVPVAFSGTVPAQSGAAGTAMTSLSLGGYFSGTRTPFTYSVATGALPPGLSLNSSTGTIAGTPTTAGSYAATIRATDSGGGTATTGSIAWAIAAAADTVAPAWPNGATIAVTNLASTSYTATPPNATDAAGVTAYRWRINGGAWTSGQVAAVTGRTPATTDTLEFQAGDAAGNWSTSLSRSITLAAAPPAADTTPPAWPNGAEIGVTGLSSTGYTATVQAATDAVGVTAYRWTLAGSVLSGVTGTTYTRTGGTPGGTDALTVVALDAAGNASEVLSKSVTLQAAPVLPKRVRVRLTTDGQAPAAGLSGLSAAFFDVPLVYQLGAPSAKAQGLGTDSDGYLVLDVTASALPIGGIGYLVESNSNGNPASAHSGWHGPVIVEAA